MKKPIMSEADAAYVYALHLPGEEYRYVGVTINPSARKVNHRSQAKKAKTPVQRWVNKHADFEMTVIGIYETYEQALAMEIYWIEAVGVENLLNITAGGEGPIGRKLSDESKRKISSSKMGHEVSEETKEKLRKANLGLKVSAGTKEKMSRSAQRIRAGGSSQYHGVSWNKARNKWEAKIRVGGKSMCLGYFSDELEAARAYDTASIKYHKEYGTRNNV